MQKNTGYQAILDFWFLDSGTCSERVARQSSLWWGKDESVDSKISTSFGDSLGRLVAGELGHWKREAQGWLASIILADQFSRNIYRNSAKAFAQDDLALALSIDGIDQGIDVQLDLLQRAFFYLPFEHAESMAMQRRSVALQKQLLDSAPEDEKDCFTGFYNYALAHLEVIEKFGRYPHRNTILGRTSTAEELEYLNQPGSGF